MIIKGKSVTVAQTLFGRSKCWLHTKFPVSHKTISVHLVRQEYVSVRPPIKLACFSEMLASAEDNPESYISAHFFLRATVLMNPHPCLTLCPPQNLIIENGDPPLWKGAHVCANPEVLNIVHHKDLEQVSDRNRKYVYIKS